MSKRKEYINKFAIKAIKYNKKRKVLLLDTGIRKRRYEDIHEIGFDEQCPPEIKKRTKIGNEIEIVFEKPVLVRFVTKRRMNIAKFGDRWALKWGKVNEELWRPR